jgi:hypothetical protein
VDVGSHERTRVRTEQNVDHIRMHHQPFRLKIYCPGCPKLLGVDISSEHRKHVEGCVPRLSISGYTEVTFSRYRGNATYCGERLWMDPMDIYDGITCAVGKKAIYGWYRRVTMYSLIVEQIQAVRATLCALSSRREIPRAGMRDCVARRQGNRPWRGLTLCFPRALEMYGVQCLRTASESRNSYPRYWHITVTEELEL